MNLPFSITLVHAIENFAFGAAFAGVPFALFTLILLRRLKKRVERYELVYVPMRLEWRTLCRWLLIVYPLVFGIMAFVASMFHVFR